jgi:hypothetical protein
MTSIDLPLKFHPAGNGDLWVDTPNGAGGATDIRAELGHAEHTVGKWRRRFAIPMRHRKRRRTNLDVKFLIVFVG